MYETRKELKQQDVPYLNNFWDEPIMLHCALSGSAMAKLQDITPQEALRTTCPSQSVLPHPLEDPSISCPITRQLSSCVIKMEPQWAENEVNWSLTEIKFQRWGFTRTKWTLKRLLTLEQLQIKPHRLRSCPKCIFIHFQTVSNSTAVPLWIDMHFRPNMLFKKLLNGSVFQNVLIINVS